MTPHDHRQFVPGCYRCELGLDEVEAQQCAANRVPRTAIDAMIHMSARPVHDDGHTDCYYAGLLIAALPPLLADREVLGEMTAAIHEALLSDELEALPGIEAQAAFAAREVADALVAALGTTEADRG